MRKVVALFPYVAENSQEIDLNSGDVITVLQEDPSGWWTGSINGRTGLFPSNFTQPYSEPSAKPPPAAEPKPQEELEPEPEPEPTPSLPAVAMEKVGVPLVSPTDELMIKLQRRAGMTRSAPTAPAPSRVGTGPSVPPANPTTTTTILVQTAPQVPCPANHSIPDTTHYPPQGVPGTRPLGRTPPTPAKGVLRGSTDYQQPGGPSRRPPATPPPAVPAARGAPEIRRPPSGNSSGNNGQQSGNRGPPPPTATKPLLARTGHSSPLQRAPRTPSKPQKPQPPPPGQPPSKPQPSTAQPPPSSQSQLHPPLQPQPPLSQLQPQHQQPQSELALVQMGPPTSQQASAPARPAPSATQKPGIIKPNRPVSVAVGGYVRMSEAYTAEEPGELTFQEGELVKVERMDDSGWWYGELNGDSGWFSVNFVDPEPVSSTTITTTTPITPTTEPISNLEIQPATSAAESPTEGDAASPMQNMSPMVQVILPPLQLILPFHFSRGSLSLYLPREDCLYQSAQWDRRAGGAPPVVVPL